jgi:cyclase
MTRDLRRTLLHLGAGLGAAAVVAAGVRAAAQPAETRSVRLRTLGPGDILYVLLGGGGNALALARDDGVVLIDTKLPGWGAAIREAIEAATDRPVTTIVNTHAHLDHVGSNPDFPTATTIVAHPAARARMQTLDAFTGPGARFLPGTLVGDRLSLLDGRDRMDLHYFGRGHTDGDLVVVFPEKRLAYFGDLFPSKAVPIIDRASGGSAVALPDTLARAAAAVTGVTRVVTGHAEGLSAERDPAARSVDISTPRTLAWRDVEEYALFTRQLLASARESLQAGRTAAEAAARVAALPGYDGYDFAGAAAYVEAAYAELRAP